MLNKKKLGFQFTIIAHIQNNIFKLSINILNEQKLSFSWIDYGIKDGNILSDIVASDTQSNSDVR